MADNKSQYNIIHTLNKKEKDLVEKKSSCFVNDNCINDLCDFLHKKFGVDDDNQFTKLSKETKIKGCLEHLVIGLTSGDINNKEVEEIIEKY